MAATRRLRDKMLSIANWRALPDPSLSSYRPGLATFVAVEGIVRLVLIPYSCAIALLFLRKKRSFPLHFTCLAISLFISHLMDVAGVRVMAPEHDIAKSVGVLVQSFFSAALWISYLRVSRRAAGTFVD